MLNGSWSSHPSLWDRNGVCSHISYGQCCDDRVGDMYAAYPMEADLERGKERSDLPVRRISRLRRFHQPQTYRRAVAPRIPPSLSQMDLGSEPEEYPRGAGGVRPAGSVDRKQGENHLAAAVLAILFSLVILAALGYLAKQLLMKRQAGAMLGETGRDVRNKDPALLKKPRNLTRITIEVEDLSGNPNPNLSVFSIQLSRRSLPYSASPHSNPLSLTSTGSEESMMTPARPQARRHQTVVLS